MERRGDVSTYKTHSKSKGVANFHRDNRGIIPSAIFVVGVGVVVVVVLVVIISVSGR